MVYPIVVYGDPVLRKRAEDIPHNGYDVAGLAADMFETMYAAHGIGLAAPQIGKAVRMFVVDGTGLEDEPNMQDSKKVFINPVILEEFNTAWEFEEGCLSIPEVRETIQRHEIVTVQATNELGQVIEITADGMMSRCLQHEIDHLDGVLFIDHLTTLRREFVRKQIQKLAKPL